MTLAQEIAHVRLNRCEEPCCEAPECRAWMEVLDKTSYGERLSIKTHLRNDPSCPLFNEVI